MTHFTPTHFLAGRFHYILLSALLIGFIVSGCASYGKLSSVAGNETGALLDDFMSRTDQYAVHYHGNSQKIVSGILFDPKGDTLHIRPQGVLWNEISDPERQPDADRRLHPTTTSCDDVPLATLHGSDRRAPARPGTSIRYEGPHLLGGYGDLDCGG